MSEKLEDERNNNEQKLSIATVLTTVCNDDKNDIAFKKAFTTDKYSGEEPLTSFLDDLKIKSLTRER